MNSDVDLNVPLVSGSSSSNAVANLLFLERESNRPLQPNNPSMVSDMLPHDITELEENLSENKDDLNLPTGNTSMNAEADPHLQCDNICTEFQSCVSIKRPHSKSKVDEPEQSSKVLKLNHE